MTTMSLRDRIEQRPQVFVPIALVVIVATLFFALRSHHAGDMAIPSAAYYSTDDGATFFTDAANRISPFGHQGTPAYRAMVYTCDGGKTRFVAYLQRLTEEARRRVAISGNSSLDSAAIDRLGVADIEIKKPGSNNAWINRTNLSAAAAITAVHCPDGSPATLCEP
jgi:hypothetical protein